MSTLDGTVSALLDGLAASRPAPAAGTALGVTLGQAAALTVMALRAAERAGNAPAHLDDAERLCARAGVLVDADAAAYAEMIALRRERDVTDDALRAAWERATDVPLELVELARQVAELAGALVGGGAPALRGDAFAAASLAGAVAAAATELVRINTAAGGLDDDRLARAERWCEATHDHLAAARHAIVGCAPRSRG